MKATKVDRTISRRLAAASLLYLVVWSPACSKPRELWLAPIYRMAQGHELPENRNDFWQLFRANPSWATSRVNVIQVPTQLFWFASDSEIRAMLSDLRGRHLALGMETLIIPGTSCGIGVRGFEGYSPPGSIAAIAAKIKRLGGDLQYVVMDEPLWYGHFASAPKACHTPIHQLAAMIAGQIKALRSYFPDVKVGDIEPIGTPEPRDWLQQMLVWCTAYRNEAGTPLEFLRADIDWHGDWKDALKKLSEKLKLRGIALGVIYNGNEDAQSSGEWDEEAERRFSEIENSSDFLVGQAVLQSWTPLPRQNLPESRPGTLTYLVSRYIAIPTKLFGKLSSNGTFEGQLRTREGDPVGQARVEISALDNRSTKPGKRIFAALRRIGVVPSGSRSATIALRVNIECGCDGAADLEVRDAAYKDLNTGESISRLLVPNSPAGQEGMREIVIPSNGTLAFNSPAFQVHVNDSFVIESRIAATLPSRKSGYLAVIFLDKDGNGISRTIVDFRTGKVGIGSALTDSDGRFRLHLTKADWDTGMYQFSYAGSASLRATSADVFVR